MPAPTGPAEGAAGSPARAIAIEVLRRVLRGAFLAPTLRRQLDASDLDGRDRSFVTDLSYGTVRRLAWLDAALAPRLRAPERLPERVRAALRLGAYDLLVRGTPRPAAVHAWVETVKAEEPRLAGLVNAVLRRLEVPDASAQERLGIPAWLLERFRASLGDEAAERAALAMLEPAPLWLLAYDEGATDSLTADGCEVHPGPLAATLRVRAPMPLDRLDAYRRGLVQPQNPSSALAAGLLGVRAGERALDLAAGNGIKTAQLASLGAAVTAVDVDPGKAAARDANLARLGLAADHLVADLTRPVDLPPAPAVLLDAPCTGTGTLRGHPEIKLRLGPDDVHEAAARQSAMLDTAAALTAPGGHLAYAVCSLTDLEGEAQIAAFLRRHPDFRAAPLRPPLPHVTTPGGCYLVPEDGLDGFFVALLIRGARGTPLSEASRA
ncbi:MAG: transcription antitermination factor NusB [Deinococcales bacterium]